jgi:hypothetical protein
MHRSITALLIAAMLISLLALIGSAGASAGFVR